MVDTSFDGLEVVRVIRCGGDLTLSGASAPAISIHSNVEPESRRLDGTLELVLPAGGALEIPPGVALEVLDCAGSLSAHDLKTPLSLGRMRGHLTLHGVAGVKIHGKVSGHLVINGAGAIAGEHLGGSLEADGAQSIRLSHVAGNAELRAIAGDVNIDSVAGRLSLSAIRGSIAAHSVGGKLEAEDTAALDIGSVGGKAKVAQAGPVRIGRVGGRLSIERAAAVSAASVGGHASLAAIAGDVNLPEVGGAADLAGPLPSSGNWRVRSRGRISLEAGPDASFELDAFAGWGRIRLHGIDGQRLAFNGRNKVAGRVGSGAGGLKVSLATHHADVVITGLEEQAREYDCRFRSRQFSRRLAASFENLAEDLGENIPDVLDELLGQVGKLVARGGPLSGGVVKDFARELKHGLGGALHDLERTFDELGERIPDDVTEHLRRFGKHLRDLGREASRQDHPFSYEARQEMREKINAAVREMREALVKATREARAASPRSSTERPPESSAAPDNAPSEGPQEGTRPQRVHDRDVMAILEAVREGKLGVAEADDLIAAWIEVKGAAPAKDV